MLTLLGASFTTAAALATACLSVHAAHSDGGNAAKRLEP
jgi:hypothetical protein